MSRYLARTVMRAVENGKADEGVSPEDRELGKRLGAGRGYTLKTRTTFARDLDVPTGDVEAWEKGEFGSQKRPNTRRRKREEAVKAVHTASGLPLAFFSIDLDLQKLPDMLTAWRQVQEESPEATGSSLTKDEEQTLPGGSSDSRSEEPSP